jgi:hypothetical protein
MNQYLWSTQGRDCQAGPQAQTLWILCVTRCPGAESNHRHRDFQMRPPYPPWLHLLLEATDSA